LIKPDLGSHLLLSEVLLGSILMPISLTAIIARLLILLLKFLVELLLLLVLHLPVEKEIVYVISDIFGVIFPHGVHVHQFF
jgi:hypothetical protein